MVELIERKYTTFRLEIIRHWEFDLPKNDWIAFTIANKEDEELIPPVVKVCIDNNVSYTSSSGELAYYTEDYFDEEIVWCRLDEMQPKKEFDTKNSIVTLANKDFEEAFWFTSTLFHNDGSDIDKLVCIDFTKRKVKNHLIELIEKINNGFLPNE